MENKLRILVLEDRVQDSDLLVRELRRSGFDFDWERVEDEEDFILHLAAEPDIILADYSMPQFDAIRALEILREKNIDIPFIITSGTIGEDAAVKAMKAGANDFFAKDKLVRLGAAIERELREASDRKRRRNTENQLRESEERFRLIAENSTDMIARHTPEGVYLYVSPACYRLLGYQPEELIGQPITDFLHPDDLKLVILPYAANLNLHDTDTADYRLRRKEGDYLWLETTSKIIRDPDTAAILEIQSAARDITERKRSEESMRQYNQRLKTLHAIDSAILTAQSGNVIAHLALQYFKEQMSISEISIVSLDFEAHEGIIFATHSQREDPSPVEIRIALVDDLLEDIKGLQTGSIQLIEDATAIQRLPLGVQVFQRRDLRVWLRVPLVAQNELIGILNLGVEDASIFNPEFTQVAREVADQLAIAIQQMRMDERISRHAAELEQRVVERTSELEWAKRRVESILNSSSDAIIMSDAEGLIVQTNPGFYALFGLEMDSALGSSLMSLVKESYVDMLRQTLQQVSRNNQSMRIEVICRHKEGREIAADMVLAPLPERFRSGHRNVICSVRDISDRKRMEEELVLALETERELNELKSSFVSIVSHEFRTPLTSILSSSQLLKLYRNRMSEERQNDHLDKIETQVRRLTDLLNDVLTLSKAEAVGMEFSPAALDLEMFCRNLTEEIQVITKTPHHIAFTQSGECVDFVGDEKLLRQIGMNLLTNAIKYSPEGGTIYFELTCENEWAVLTFRDEGLGIPEEDQKHLFQPFHRAKNVRDIPGTGLGLPIVKRAVEAHGGQITMKSKLGAGTTFLVTLPLSPLKF